ncbi:MAG: hypothetical protein IH820_09040 [Bacteroidetes bacterium]|nr:hypothetical protein [Bacteroidota bacterium]
MTATDPDASDTIRARGWSGFGRSNPDGTLTIRYPWLAVIFYGPNRIFANAIDDNLITGAFGPRYDAVFRRQRARYFFTSADFFRMRMSG